jgi:hypothetical protein
MSDDVDNKLHPVPTVGEALPALRRIVETKSIHQVPGGLPVDLLSASAIVAVYDALSPAARTKFEAMTLLKGQSVAFKLIERFGE